MAKLTFPLNIFGGGGTITPGTTPVASGTDKGIFFQDGQTISNSTNLRYDKVTRRIIGDTTNPYVELIDATGATLGYGTNSFFRAAGVPSVAVSSSGVTAWQAAGIGVGTLVYGAGATLTGAFDVGISRSAAATYALGNGTVGNATGTLTCASVQTSGTAFMVQKTGTLANGAAAQVATMTNGPTAGNPTKWVAIDDNGTTRYIPAW